MSGGTAPRPEQAQPGEQPVEGTLASLAHTGRVGLALAGALPERAIVLLEGEMGAGKTTLIKALCEGLGIDPRIVISPTYTLVNVYPGRRSVYHVDLFRMEDAEALWELDRDDWVNPAGPTLVEWPRAARPLLAGDAVLELALALVPGEPEQRRLTARGAQDPYGPALAALAAALGGGQTTEP